jgi:hypothetical protein
VGIDIGQSSSDPNAEINATTSIRHVACEATTAYVGGAQLITLGAASHNAWNIFLAGSPESLAQPRRTSGFEIPVFGDASLWRSGVGYETLTSAAIQAFLLPEATIALIDSEPGNPRGESGVLVHGSVDGAGVPSCSHRRAFTAAVRRSEVSGADPNLLVGGLANIAALSVVADLEGHTHLRWSGTPRGSDLTHSDLNPLAEYSFGPIAHPDGEAWSGSANLGFQVLSVQTWGFEGVADASSPDIVDNAVITLDGFVEYFDGQETRRYSKSLWCYLVEQPLPELVQCTTD